MEQIHSEAGPVLDDGGRPRPGYSTRSVLSFDRRRIVAPPWRIKEWDFYQVMDGELCVQFTVGHASYAGQVGIMVFDYRQGRWLADKSRLLVLPFGSLKLPSDGEKDHQISYEKGDMAMSFRVEGDKRYLSCHTSNVDTELILTRKNPHSLVITVPFDESPRAFYYNQKINCMVAEGSVSIDGAEHRFDPRVATGLLDWGRGVWPFSNTWYWSNGTGYVDGELFGFNLGSGFGNTEAATENILFYREKAHKLGKVSFELGKTFMDPWRISDTEGRLDLTLTPSFDRTTRTKLLWIDNECHQMFGDFAGTARLDDGSVVRIHSLPAFAEKAVNNW